MAKFTGGDLRLKDGQKVTFGTSLDSNLWWDGSANDLRLDTTISGVNPTQDYHLTTKWYVDDEIATLSGSIVLDHGALTGLLDDDHPQYVPTDASRGFTATVSGIDPTQPYHLTTKSYVDTAVGIGGYWERNGTVLKPKTADDTVEIPASTGGKIELGTLDNYSRYQIWNYLTDSVLRLGSSSAEGDATDVESEGWVVYGKNLESDPMAVADFGYARAKSDRFGLYNSKDGGYAGYLFRIDLSSNDCYLSDNTGVKTLQFDRLTGELIINGDITASGIKLSECILIDGSKAFTGVVGGITPTAANHLTTKQYVDNAVYGLDWKDSVLDIVPIASGVQSTGNRYIASATGGGWTINQIYEWDGTQWVNDPVDEGAATWVEDEDGVYVFNSTNWVKFGNTVTHNNLSGLQGGTSNEYYHLTSTMYGDLTSDGGVGNASSQHIHDDRYYTESESDTISGSLQTQIDDINTNFDENAQDAVGNIMVGAGGVSVNYDDVTPQITISGTAGVTDHGALTGLLDDDHTQYILVDGSRGFTATVSGVDPTQDYHLATKSYVDAGGMDRHGRQAVANGASTVTVNFATLGHTNYTVNATLENTTDSPPSIYAFIVSGRTVSSFTVTMMGDADSANYVLNWSVIED